MIKILALVGEAGTGKDTLLHEFVKQHPDKYKEIISCTTRPPRENEKDGVDYYFLSPKEFHWRDDNGDMLETSHFNGWFYGTSKRQLEKDKINVGVFNPQGIRNLLTWNDGIQLSVIRVTCSAKTRLIRQLNRESNPNVDEIVRRYGTDQADFKVFDRDKDDFKVEAVVENERLEDIQEIVQLMDKCIKFS